MIYATFSTRQAAEQWLKEQNQENGLSGYILKICEGTYNVRAWS